MNKTAVSALEVLVGVPCLTSPSFSQMPLAHLRPLLESGHTSGGFMKTLKACEMVRI